jgi:NAD(P) transhydrogenase subunit alpha
VKLITDGAGALAINRDDDIVAACLVCEGGAVTRRP